MGRNEDIYKLEWMNECGKEWMIQCLNDLSEYNQMLEGMDDWMLEKNVWNEPNA